MQIAILSDVHGNLQALDRALADIDARGIEHVVCLGDVVGYGPDPEACVARVRARCELTVQGNHDAAVASEAGLDVLPKDGQTAARLHREWLGDGDVAWLAALPLRVDRPEATYVHASPARPADWERLDSFLGVRAQFETFEAPVCFVGHSHKPAVASASVGVFKVRPGHRFLVDVGSVGQPRDHDPRLSYAVYDTDAFSVDTVRLHYDLALTTTRIHERGLPSSLGERLSLGT